MGKGDSRRGKHKNKATWEAAVALAPVPPRRPCGRHVEYNEGAKDPRKTALDARCRLFGLKPNRKNRHDLSGPHNASQLGMVMQALVKPGDIPALWAVWQGFAMAERTYRMRYLGQSGTAKGASIAMVREPLETDQSHSVDTRTNDEKDRDAVNNWMRWRGFIGHLSRAGQVLLHDLEQNRLGELWVDGRATQKGLATLASLQKLALIVNGGKR